MARKHPAASPAGARAPSRSDAMVVRDPHSGRSLRVRGAGALAGEPLPLREGLDLTKPIFEQVSRAK